jgi:hypothetical protein
MAQIEVDFAGVKENDFSPFPAGEYELALARVIAGKVKKEGPNKGKAMFRLMFKVTDNNEKYVGRTVWTNYVHTEESRWVLKALLQAYGVAVPESGAVTIDFDDYMGEPLRARVKVTPGSKSEDGSQEYADKNDIQYFIKHPSLVDA